MSILKTPACTNTPEVKSKLSPGKKKPINRPDSAKITKSTANHPAVVMIVTKSSPGIAPKLTRVFKKISCMYTILAYKWTGYCEN